MSKKLYLVVNFGGPRSLDEVESFLKTLLLDKDVVRTPLPNFLHDFLFKRIAKKRAKKVGEDYLEIGGKSPIFGDTEWVAGQLRKYLEGEVLTFHRYLPQTHTSFFQQIEAAVCDEIIVIPQFPQFTYATTGSSARFFEKHLSFDVVRKMHWIKSYPAYPPFIALWHRQIQEFLEQKNLKEQDVLLLFSAHGVPYNFVKEGDVYEYECQQTFQAVAAHFPRALCRLCYQSKFGPGAWLKPYTEAACKTVLNWCRGKEHVVFVPLSFTSDHIETLFEIEKEYLPLIEERGLKAHRVPAFNRREQWVEVLASLVNEPHFVNTQMLIR